MSANLNLKLNPDASSKQSTRSSGRLQFSHLRKVFQDSHTGQQIVAVEDFSLEAEPGELVTLLGPSGCGKTTVLRMLAGFESPTSGEILLNGQRINQLPPNQRNSAMVFQSYALFPHMNVEQNILYGLKIRGVGEEEKEKRLSKILKTVNLIGYERRKPNELSGGQQQRVALARALIVEPSILLFDEPLSNLDAKLRESMRNEIRLIQKALGITAVYVTHDQSEAMAISDRVVVMNRARIEQVGIPEVVYSKPKTRFVADFMGAANFIPARLVSQVERNDGFVVVRPENLRLTSDTKGLSAQITEIHFLGSHYEYQLRCEENLNLVARVPSNQAQFTSPHTVGTQVHISFKDSDIHWVAE